MQIGPLRWTAVLLVVTATLGACGSNPEDAGSGHISFAGNQDGDWELYVADLENGMVRRLTNNSAYDTGVVWSPDGNRYVLVTEFLAGEIQELEVAGEDGSMESVRQEVTQDRELLLIEQDGTPVWLTDNSFSDQNPTWSPDGRQIAFVSDRTDHWDFEIHVMDADGSNVRRLTTSPGDDWQPSWSPDGKEIVFASVRDGNWEIHVMDADGSNVRRLTARSGVDWTPEWSPDGKQIAFASNETGVWQIYVMNADGSSVEQLTDDPRSNIEPTWSPDGMRLAFASQGSTQGTNQIVVSVMNADGSQRKAIAGLFGIPSDWTVGN